MHVTRDARYKISDVSDREAQDIRNLTGIDISGFEHRLNESALNHVDKRHGAKGKGNQTMAHSEDVARIGYVLANYDSIELLKKNGKPVTSYEFRNRDNSQAPIVLFKKQLDGTCYVASVVQDSKRRIMWVMSAYLDNSGIKNRQPNREYPMQDYPPQVRTPEAPTRSQLSDSEAAYANSTANIIPDSSASVNASSDDLTQTAPRIYRNGTLLFAGMDEAELTSEIAREGRISQDPDPAVSELAKERLQALRSERDTRADAGAKDARRARRDAARTDRLAEIDEMIKAIPEAPDGELSRHRNYCAVR